MINNVNITFTITPLLVISGRLLDTFMLVDILAEGEGLEPSKTLQTQRISSFKGWNNKDKQG